MEPIDIQRSIYSWNKRNQSIWCICLRINVDITGATNGSHPVRITVSGPSDKTLCHDMDLTAADRSILFYFCPGLITDGQPFEACIILLDTNKKNCVNGLNHQYRIYCSIATTALRHVYTCLLPISCNLADKDISLI